MGNKESVIKKFITLDCKCEVDRNSMGNTTGTSKVHTMQIACINSLDGLKCVIRIVLNLTAFPNEFIELLRTSNLKIVGVSFGGDIDKIGRDFRCDNITKNLKHVCNLGSTKHCF